MQKRKRGFTLIELVIVIVILGILSVVAIPRFIDLSGSANSAAVAGVAGALSAASAANYAARKAGVGSGTVAIANCQTAASLLQGGTLPSGYTIASLAITADTTSTCTVQNASASTSFTATGVT